MCVCTCTCVCVTRIESTAREQWEQAGRGTERERDGPNERDRNRTMEAHTETKGMFTLVVETFLYPSRFLRFAHHARYLPSIQRSNVEPRSSWSGNEISDESSSNETRLSPRRAHICARPTRARLYYYRLNPLLSLGPGVEASIPRRRLRATPDPPFPTRAFSQRIGSKPAGATPRRPARTKSFLLAHRPRNTRKSTRFSANSRPSPRILPSPISCEAFSLSLSLFFLEFYRWPGTLSTRSTRALPMSVNGAVSSLHAEAGSRPPFTISIAKLLRVAAASYIFTRLLSRFSSGRRGNDVESHSAWIFLEIFEYL